ncbi:glucose 1-dehydrogenase [Zavarzinia sp. CC-PAN008]|uniref:glucose 1-dehydrogenase n=1 Tax=Zavarzinia sp. CC-PAN008 TaxID=3243332 RepID=UPI003F748FDB
MARLQGKVALVTGGASGLGAASARLLAGEGARVILSDLAEDAGEAVAAAIRGAGGDALFEPQDVADEARWDSLLASIRARYGALHVLVNNAGIVGTVTGVHEMALADWRRTLSINLDGVFLGIRHGVPLMVETGGGSIINLSSIMGLVGAAGGSAYCASKGGVRLLTKAAAIDLAPLGIRVNSIHPGYIETPMVQQIVAGMPDSNTFRADLETRHALGRLGQPVDIAEAVLFLASDASRFMTGSELVVDGGYTAQ